MSRYAVSNFSSYIFAVSHENRATHPKVSQKRPCRTLFGGGGSHVNFALYRSYKCVAVQGCCSYWGNPKQPMKLQQPRNYNFGMFQFNLLVSQGGNSREMVTSPSGHHCEATVALTTAAKLQQFRANKHEMTSQKLNNRCHRSMRFCVVPWLLSFQVPLGIL